MKNRSLTFPKRLAKALIVLTLPYIFTACVVTPPETALPQPSATATSTSTPVPTPTPTPVIIEGRLFFDMNGSGLRDEASFQYDSARLTDERQPLQADLLAAINTYLLEHPDIKDGDLVTLEEPGLTGYTVYAGTSCVTTDDEGRFQLVQSEVEGRQNVTIKDPNEGTPALEMRYTNKWISAVTIRPYKIDAYDDITLNAIRELSACSDDAKVMVCVQDENTIQIREQKLNDTAIMPINRKILLTSTELNEIGLMQGFLTAPYSLTDFSSYWISNYVDLNPVEGDILIFNKMNNMYWSRPTSEKNTGGSGDQHNGIDFEGPENTLIFAAFPGIVYETMGTKTPILLLGNMENVPYKISNGHHNGILVAAGKVYRGQIIGLNGIGSNGGHPHNHFGLYQLRDDTDARVGPDDLRIDPFGVLWVDKPITITYPNRENESVYYDSYSSWTLYNSPVFP